MPLGIRAGDGVGVFACFQNTGIGEGSRRLAGGFFGDGHRLAVDGQGGLAQGIAAARLIPRDRGFIGGCFRRYHDFGNRRMRGNGHDRCRAETFVAGRVANVGAQPIGSIRDGPSRNGQFAAREHSHNIAADISRIGEIAVIIHIDVQISGCSISHARAGIRRGA